MFNWRNKRKINALLNIDNFFGDYQGRMLPIIIFIAIAGAPVLAYAFILQLYIPIKFFVPVWVLWTARWALKIIGREDKKMLFYDSQRGDEYASADDLIYTSFVHEDGLVEMQNGVVGYFITGFPKAYINDDAFSVDMEAFLNELDMWTYDMYFQNVVDEIRCEDNLPRLARYKDKEVIQDRIDFYNRQDEYARTHASMYRYVFFVYASKYDWKKLKSHVTEIVQSELAQCFNEIEIADKHTANELYARDLMNYLDFNKMLTKKYDNTDYHDSKVLWYDNKVPDKYKQGRDHSGLEERRVSK